MLICLQTAEVIINVQRFDSAFVYVTELLHHYVVLCVYVPMC